MKSDPLSFGSFNELPRCFFHLVRRPADEARRYRLEAIEYKQTAVRLDGVFLPIDPEADPAYLWEVQMQKSDALYAQLLSRDCPNALVVSGEKSRFKRFLSCFHSFVFS